MSDSHLGKITKATFGRGGYQDACLGLDLEFNCQGAIWGQFYGFWSGEPKRGAEWTKETQITRWGEAVARLDQLLRDCKVSDVNGLIGKPVMVMTENGMFKDYRILTEVM